MEWYHAQHGNVSACGDSRSSRCYSGICDIVCTVLILLLCLLDACLGGYNLFSQVSGARSVENKEQGALLMLYGALQIQFAFIFGMLIYFRVWLWLWRDSDTQDADINLPNHLRWPEETQSLLRVTVKQVGGKTHFLGARVYGYLTRTVLWTTVTFGWIPLGFFNYPGSMMLPGPYELPEELGRWGLIVRQSMASVALFAAFPAYYGLLDSCFEARYNWTPGDAGKPGDCWCDPGGDCCPTWRGRGWPCGWCGRPARPALSRD